MSFIGYVPYKDGSEEMKKIYDRCGGEEKVANIVRITSFNPKAMEGHLALYRAIMFNPSPLSRDQREMIATFVSMLNSCHY